jgi:hypothetical protein
MSISKLINSITPCLYLIILFLAGSCSDNDMIEPSVCGPNGVALEGSSECFCTVFYEGEFCEIEIREKFIGRWIGLDHNCTHMDSIPDGFVLDLIKTNDVAEVRIESQDILLRDVLISTVSDINILRLEEFQTVGSSVIRTYAMEIVYDSDTDELSVIIADNQDFDETIDGCRFLLRRE